MRPRDVVVREPSRTGALMQALNKQAGEVLDALTADLPIGGSRKIDNEPGVYMAVHVERLSTRVYSVAHYFEANGDLVPDPDGEFIKVGDGSWLPVSLQQSVGLYTQALQVEANDVTDIKYKALRSLMDFADLWLSNIYEQQGGLEGIRAAGKPA